MQELGDSLMQYTRFSRIWSPNVRVTKMRVNENKITIHTNATLSGISWNEQKITEIERKVSQWVLGHENGQVTIYTQQINLKDLITPCASQHTTYNIQHTTYNIRTSQKDI